MTVERLTENTTGIEIRREDFGPGYAGNWSYRTVLSGAPCVTYIDEYGNMCGDPPVGTVDIDVRDDLEFFPFCSPEHQQLVQEQILSDLHRQGRSSVPGVNGFGRA